MRLSLQTFVARLYSATIINTLATMPNVTATKCTTDMSLSDTDDNVIISGLLLAGTI